MKLEQLSEYRGLENVLSPIYFKEFQECAKSTTQDRYARYVIIYAVFIDIAVNKAEIGYNALDIRSNEDKFNQQYKALIGFIYERYFEFSLDTKRKYCSVIRNIFQALAQHFNMNLEQLSFSYKAISGDVLTCIATFNSLTICEKRIAYYNGWVALDKEGKEHNLHLSIFYDTFGSELTETIHKAFFNFIRTQKSSSAKTIVLEMTKLLNAFTKLCKTSDELLFNLQSERSHLFFEAVMNFQFGETIRDGYEPKIFFNKWASRVRYFTNCFIEVGIFSEPIRPFIVPDFKEPKDNACSFSIGGNLTENEKNRWLVDIPLHVRDEQALRIIQQRLNQDLDHIRAVNHKLFCEIVQRQKENETFIETGSVKTLTTCKRKCIGPTVGLDSLENTIATFYHHGFGAKDKYSNFLGFYGEVSKLQKVLNLPTPYTLNICISLLVLEHPKITPSWLSKWELYDKSGNIVGFKQVGNQWIALSYKDRRGTGLAQMEVELNHYTKSIVKFLIRHTQFARDALADKGGDDWRYMLLTANTVRPTRSLKLLENITSHKAAHLYTSSYRKSFLNIPFSKNTHKFINIERITGPILNQILDKSEAKELSQTVTPRAIRKSRGLQIYLETRSLRAVAEALGHKEVSTKLLGIYLPKPLMDYFNERWVRQFQNAIVFEALKDSSYLFDALDFDEHELEEFLHNHGLGKLPYNLEKAQNSATNEENQADIEGLDELVFTLSKPLFQVLIAIQAVVETANENDTFRPIVNRWHEATLFILNSFKLESRIHIDALPLYEDAKNNPINIAQFKENLLCR